MEKFYVINPKSSFHECPQTHYPTFSFSDRFEANERISDIITQETQNIVIVGGDGTVNSVVNSVLKKPHFSGELHVYPGGTGNDYYKSLKETPQKVDVGFLSSPERVEGFYFINMASMGISADVIMNKEKWNLKSYKLATLLTLPFFECINVYIRSPSFHFDGDVLAVMVCKGQYAGGGMHFAEDVELEDGLFEVTVIEKQKLLSLIRYLPLLFKGSLKNIPGIHKFRCNQLSIMGRKPIGVEYDGEVFGRVQHISCRLESKRLTLSRYKI